MIICGLVSTYSLIGMRPVIRAAGKGWTALRFSQVGFYPRNDGCLSNRSWVVRHGLWMKTSIQTSTTYQVTMQPVFGAIRTALFLGVLFGPWDQPASNRDFGWNLYVESPGDIDCCPLKGSFVQKQANFHEFSAHPCLRVWFDFQPCSFWSEDVASTCWNTMKHLDFPEVFLGSVSDVMGRRPLVRAVGMANTMPLLAVLLHLTTGAGGP